MKGKAKSTFIDDCLQGYATLDDFEDYVEYWHTHETGNTLSEYLGLTNDEYSQFLINSDDYLSEVLKNRRNKA